jgi:dihydrofolate reductase
MVIMGSGSLVSQLAQEGVIDEYQIVVVKIVGGEAFVLNDYLTDRTKRGVLLWLK